MEHLLFHLIVEGIQALDRRLQKPIAQAVPELARLRSDPQGYLRQAPVVIGPRRRQTLALVIGLISGLVTIGIILFIYAKMRRPGPIDQSRVIGFLLTFATVAFVARSIALYTLRGGTMTLRPQGVELTQDDASLFLPWELFCAAGGVFEADQKNVVLPIDPTVPVAVGGADGSVRAVLPAALESPLVDCDAGQMAFKDLYEVRLVELGELLHEVGQQMTDPARITSMAVPPLAVADEDGWLRLHLTQLPLPSICAGCGEPTPETLELPVAMNRRALTLAIPLCTDCRRRRTRAALFGLLGGIAVGVLVGCLIGVVTFGGLGNPKLVAMLAVAFSLVIGLPAGLIARVVARDAKTPVSCKEYKPDRGTVRIRFRDPKRSSRLMLAMGASPPAAAMGEVPDESFGR